MTIPVFWLFVATGFGGLVIGFFAGAITVLNNLPVDGDRDYK